MKKLLTLVIAVGLTACSSDDSNLIPEDPATNISATITNALLNGNWLRTCVVSGPASYDVSATFSDGIGSLFATEYSDTTCSTTSMIGTTVDFTYTIGNDVTLDGSVAGITTVSEINFDFGGGSLSFDLAAINNLTILYFGDTDSDANFNGDTLDKRAIKLDPTFYTRQ